MKTLGIHPEAWKILGILEKNKFIQGIANEDADDPLYSAPFINGREHGIVVYRRKVAYVFGRNRVAYVVGRNRTSDRIFVTKTVPQGSSLFWVAPTVPSISDVEYNNRKCFEPGEEKKAAKYIIDQLKEYKP